MKNLHLLPTDKPSRFYSTAPTATKKEGYSFGEHYIPNTRNMFSNHNIYITSDEEIKEEDWVFDLDIKRIVKADSLKVITSKKPQCWYYKKIILTTDQDLIKDGVQAIDDEFLEWFVKNPSCEYVKIGKGYFKNDYEQSLKIIIPKEEPKQDLEKEMFELEQELEQEIPQLGTKEFNDLASAYFGGKPRQETLAEFAKQEAIKQYSEDTFGNLIVRKSIEKGAKWQQERMYSEEDMKEAFSMGRTGKTIEDFNIKFKNK